MTEQRVTTLVSRKGRSFRGNWSETISDAQYIAKLKSKVLENEGGCWVWQGWTHPAPREYGAMYYRGKQWRTHRLS